MTKTYQMYIGGEWVDAVGGEHFDDMNPYSGEVYARIPAGKREDATRAIEAAQAAFPEWASTPPAVRRGIFLRAADIMERRQDELVRVMMEEVGGTIGISMFQCTSFRDSTAWRRGLPTTSKARLSPLIMPIRFS